MHLHPTRSPKVNRVEQGTNKREESPKSPNFSKVRYVGRRFGPLTHRAAGVFSCKEGNTAARGRASRFRTRCDLDFDKKSNRDDPPKGSQSNVFPTWMSSRRILCYGGEGPPPQKSQPATALHSNSKMRDLFQRCVSRISFTPRSSVEQLEP
ncbi:hypothetical protein BDP81DRAFT_33131 [Colletotrichum phormii]|uniref:Uncharacterized protein n=1 Tax=Colletotrichum phormii TaxID=359342 RepID=A0AAI9ZQ09_9PEZI|nr:uncharacterized protein BDP81DRAFT_33131 [Colletotrichum phormii]KAK1636065.1 hypothetical protein BDP81DRAFT_33131 [Colletotrichum phormii]